MANGYAPTAMEALRKSVDGRLAGLRTDRYSFWLHWRELAEVILPRRYQWLVTPNKANRGSPINGQILDSTGTLAARNLAAGMMSGLTSPTRPWFKLNIPGVSSNETSSPVSLWLAEVESRMYRVMQESNFYNALAVMYFDLVVFGSAVVLIYEDFEDVIRCYNPSAGEYYLANSSRMNVDTIYREFVLTIAQVVQQFGLDHVSPSTKMAFEDKSGAGRTREILIGHAIEPNFPFLGGIPRSARFREVYWEVGSTYSDCLLVKPYDELPGFAVRWDLSSNDAYGRAPAMDALPDIKQLQQETKRKAQAIDKMVNPPLLGDIELKNQPATVLPGGITYITKPAGIGLKPIYTVMPPVQELREDIAQIQERIKDTFFNKLFLMISQLTTVRSATEIDARRQEQLVMLGPVLERAENEALDSAVNRVFSVMSRLRLFPPAPPEIAGQYVQIQYSSMLAEAQRAAGTGSIERVLGLAGNLAGIIPDIMDNIDSDEAIGEYADLLAVSPKIIRDPKIVAQIRQNKAKQAADANAVQTSLAGVKAAQLLSKTDTGGGQNALQVLTGGQ